MSAGRQRFLELMMDTDSNPREYQELFAFKVTVFSLLSAQARLHLIDHYVHFCRTHMNHLMGGMKGLQSEGPPYDAGTADADALLDVMRHRAQQWELEIEWASTLRQR